MSKVVRSVKNVTKGYTAAQVKVRNATSNDAWGPVGSDMAEIAQMTFSDTATFYEIMDILDKRLNDKGKNWRHVLKSLKVLDYCLHEGSELVVTWARKNIYVIKTLREFQHIDDDARDVGLNIRVSAKELTSLILDEERLRMERRDRKSWKSRVQGLDDYEHSPEQPKPAKRNQPRAQRADEDDLEYRLAIEASKNEAEEDARRRAKSKGADDDDDLAKAIKLSKEEEELRRSELEQANANSLFDDTPGQQPAVAQPTGWNQGYQQQPTVDWFGNVIDPQAAQQTGYSVQPTGYQNTGYGGYGQGMNQPFGQQNGAANNALMQPQQTAFNMTNNPYAQQQNGGAGFGNGFGQPQPSVQEPQATAAGSKNPFGANTTQTNNQIPVQPTGSNNPFAQQSSFNNTQQSNRQPTLSTLSEQQAASSFNPIMSYTAPQQQQPQPSYLQSPTQQTQPIQSQPTFAQSQPQQQPLDPHAAKLNSLLASGAGQDTFGNVGEMRVPGLMAQHTSPAFRNGPNANPFLHTQATGIQPAYTGPAVAYGGGNNPFGGQQGGAQGRGHQGNSNLIDL